MPVYAFTNATKLVTRSEIAAANRHALGQDQVSKRRRRSDANARCFTYDLKTQKTFLHKVGSPTLNLGNAFDAHLERTGAQLRRQKNGVIALHMIVGVSPEWIAAGGDPHDANNERVQLLTKVAAHWVENELGGVWSVRYDLDERGSAVVDVLCSPVRSHKSSGKLWVSTKKALTELAVRHGKPANAYPYGYQALQDSWTAYAQKYLDPEIKRGRDARETGAKHMKPEPFGELQDKIKANKKLAAKLAKDQAAVEALRRQAREAIETTNRAAAQVAREAAALNGERQAFEAQCQEVLQLLGKRVRDALARGSDLALAAYQALQRLAHVPEHKVLTKAEIAFTHPPGSQDRRMGHSARSFIVVDNRSEGFIPQRSPKGDRGGERSEGGGQRPPVKPKERRPKGPKI